MMLSLLCMPGNLVRLQNDTNAQMCKGVFAVQEVFGEVDYLIEKWA